MTLSLVNISVSLNNVDCHLLFILLLLSLAFSLARSLSSSHLPSLCLNRYYIRCVYLFILPPSLPSALLFSHLHFQHLTHRSVSSVLSLFLALHLPKPRPGDPGKVREVVMTRMSAEYKKFDVVLLWPVTELKQHFTRAAFAKTGPSVIFDPCPESTFTWYM